MMTVMNFQMGISTSFLPSLMFKGVIIAIIFTYLSFLLFPGDEQDIKADQTSKVGAQENVALIAFKATTMCIVLFVLMSTGSSQTMLIAITIVNIIKIPIAEDNRIYSQNKVITTVVGIFFTLPVLALFSFGVPTWVLIGVTLFCGLQLAGYAIRRQCSFSIYQLLFTNFTVLTYQVIKHQGITSLDAEFWRLLSIVIAILVSVLILNLTKHSAKPLVNIKKQNQH
ncbi:hypothetical protein GCM10007916_05680 [Psychromonas marina]|uniref:DUF2955 domain-containing protein n=2 Tax=Psychromonas marina TaxID=88364 RepID=A0ABQ6DWH7_9GAMM|nr:hypothetical protein GCM10007916_05680 [Psychromonas marina]